MSSEPPWVKYQKKAEPPPWEKYAAAQTLAQRVRKKYPGAYDDMSDTELESRVLAKYPEYADLPRTQAKAAEAAQPSESERRSKQSFMQNWMENAGEMYTTESEGLPAQAAGGLTALGMVGPGIALPALAGSAGVVGTVARAAIDPKVAGPIAFGYELLRSGDLKRAALTGAGIGSASVGLQQIGKKLAKRALTLKEAEEAFKASVRTREAAKRATSTGFRPSGGAVNTGTAAPNVVAFPRNPAEAIALLSKSAPAFPRNPAEAAALLSRSAAAAKAAPVARDAGALMRFGKEAATRDPKIGEKIWILLDEAGAPVKVLTPDQAGAAARAGQPTTWIKNLWGRR